MQTSDVGPQGRDAGGPPSPTRPRLVGAFALLGLALIVVALALLSSSSAFGQRRTFVAFFPNPVGLKAGSPVTFRQAPIGEVRSVELVFTGREFDSETMVVLDVRRDALRSLKGDLPIRRLGDREFAATLSRAGLRGTVRSSSPVGGTKSLDFDFAPASQGRLTGIDAAYPELPTGSQSRLDVLQAKVENALEKIAELPLEETIGQMRSTLAATEQLLAGGDLNGALANLRRLLETLDRAASRSERTLDSVDGLMGDARTTMSGVQDTMRTADATLERLDATLATVDRNVERTAETQHEAVRAIDELNELLRTVRQLVDTLQQHPEALLQGKPEPKKEND